MDAFPVWANLLVALGTFFAIAIGAKFVVDAAALLADRAGVSQLVIGLTVVAFGTSAPEFGVTLVAALEGRESISVGNIVGSNIFNIGFILGGAALVRAIPTGAIIVWRDAAVLVGATILLFALVGLDLQLSVTDGGVLFACLIAYMVLVFRNRHAREEHDVPLGGEGSDVAGIWVHSGLLLLGLAVVAVSSHFLVASASALARSFGVSEWVIAVTVVAAGTSVPEMATTLAGVARGHMAISAGNVIGSDIFNLLGVLGVAGMTTPMSLEPAARGSLLALTAMVFVVFVMMRSGWRVSRLEGVVLVVLAAIRWGLDFASRG
jgi:cation:H+ antiporter